MKSAGFEDKRFEFIYVYASLFSPILQMTILECYMVMSLMTLIIMAQDVTLAAMLLRPGPLQALNNARFTDDGGNVEKVPRVYIMTRHDKVVKPEQQEAMIKRWPPCTVYELDSDHSPFFSAPFLLFGLLVKAAAF